MIGYIYKILSPSTDKVYIGSTIQDLNSRFSFHKGDMKRKNMGSKEIMKYPDAEIILLEEVIFDNKKELKFKERCYYEKYKNIRVNKLNPILTDGERKINADKCKARYVIKNREKMKEKFNCDCGGKYTLSGRLQHTKTFKHLNYLSLI